MNNPIMMLIQAAQGGGDPIQILGQMAGNNPMMAQALKMVQGKSPDQLRQMAENMARERGTSAEEILRGLGIRS
nr:MAG TPA: SeqA protein N-terminal domain [Caudoviricetes sp.]